MLFNSLRVICGTVTLAVFAAYIAAPNAVQRQAQAAELTLVAKQPVASSERRAREQPTVPSEYKELPYVETAPMPTLTAAESLRGYMLFHRPITEPVYPNTHPLPHERLTRLSAFATPGELEPVTLSVFPTRAIRDGRVQVSAFRSATDEIPATAVTVRLVTYWNVGFPRYTSRETYRRLPELLERVTAHSSPAFECQRWWLTIDVPEDAKPGLYRATVRFSVDEFDQAVRIPVDLRVLDFTLRRDPAKHYSVYYNSRNSVQFQGKDEAFIQKATGNEYRAMIDYGIDTVPTLSLQTDDTGKVIVLRDAKELDRMLAVGMKGPVPITAGNVIARIYRDTTPGGERGSHWAITKTPPLEFYERVTEMFKAFEAQRKARGWPAFVCCPLDEVTASQQEFGSRVYKAVQQAGIRTYATKNPLAADAAAYRECVDVWCSQPYSAPYEKIAHQDRYEYWCYPNHNAGEIKDRRVMCKGGRMTYGYGFWRSGYTTLIPWHWAWTPKPDQFDYLRGRRSGCGQRIGDDAEVIPAIYWECFREGRDDARYIYTLQQALWEREGSNAPACRQAVASARSLLQETWNAINVQQKYLADGMWPDDEFNARRWRTAMAIRNLLKHPAQRSGTAPSVLIADPAPKQIEANVSIIERAVDQGNVEFKDLGSENLGEGFVKWRNGTDEGSAELTEKASRDGNRKGLRWRLAIDHEHDGGEGGKYPIGWPRIARSFGNGELDMSKYDYLEIVVRVDSDRDEVADDSTPLGLTITSHAAKRRLIEQTRDLGDRQHVWIPLRYPLKEMMDNAGMGPDPWKSISRLQLFVGESNYRHGCHVTFDIAQARLLRFKSPMIANLEAPRFVLLPRTQLPIMFEVMGIGTVKPGSHRIKASVVNQQGKVIAKIDQDLAASKMLVLDASTLTPGTCRLKAEVVTAGGTLCSEADCSFEALPGPLSVR